MAALLAAMVVLMLAWPSGGVLGLVSGDDGCRREKVRLVVAPALLETAEAAATSVSDECLRLVVDESSPDAVVETIEDPGDFPELWIATSPWDSDGLSLRGVTVDQIGSAPIATSPLLLVGGPAAQRTATWTDALSSDLIVLPDPGRHVEGRLSVLAPWAEAQQDGRPDDVNEELLAQLAQTESDVEGDALWKNLTTSTGRLVPITEQQFTTAFREKPELQDLTPRTGAQRVDYPLLKAGSAGTAADRAGQLLLAWFGSGDGVDALTKAGLRAGDGSKLANAPGVDQLSFLPTVPERTALTTMRGWRVLSTPPSQLAVFDVSGSMDFPAGPGSGTRMQLAAGMADTALDIFSDAARLGLWAFSIDQGGNGRDWRELAPLRRMDEQVAQTTHREVLRTKVRSLPTLTRGGTGLYDTALAAYRTAQKRYEADYFNSVVLVTDGANDDPGSIELPRLLAELRDADDTERPVRMIAIGLTRDADMPALRKIAEATGGQAYLVEKPEDTFDIFAQAIAGR